MTIGPAPMIRIEEMSVRLGMSLGDIRGAYGTKKGRAFARPAGRRRGPRPARGRSLDQNQRAGKGSRDGRRNNSGQANEAFPLPRCLPSKIRRVTVRKATSRQDDVAIKSQEGRARCALP